MEYIDREGGAIIIKIKEEILEGNRKHSMNNKC